MPQTHKVLAQNAPAATTLTTLYAVPSNTSAIVSSLTICNTGNVATTYRIAVRPGGANVTQSHYLTYDTAIPANDSTLLTAGLTLATTDVLSVYAGNGNLAFGAYGVELS